MNQQVKIRLKNRLHRLEGQLRGIEGMIDANRKSSEIIQQLWAVRQSLSSAVFFVAEEEKSLNLLIKLLKKL